MNRAENRYFQTAARMNRALLELLGEKGYEYITVKELCARAGVNRSTFYLHYDGMADLLSETVEQTLQSLLDKFEERPEDFIRRIGTDERENLILLTPRYLSVYLEFIRENRAVLRAAYSNPEALQTRNMARDLARHILCPIMRRFGVPEGDMPYYAAFYLRGAMAIVEEWLSSDCSRSDEEIAELLITCIHPVPPAEGEG